MYEIKKSVVIPEPRTSNKYPFGQMEIDDSFLVDDTLITAVRSAAWQYGHKHPPMKFIVRQTVGGSRVWRIA